MTASPKRKSTSYCQNDAIQATNGNIRDLYSRAVSSAKASCAFTVLAIVLCIILSALVIAHQSKFLDMFLNESHHPSILQVKRTGGNHGINAISIIGERNSGTTWIYEHLNDCFVDDIPVKRRLTRYKHWFQDENIGKRSVIDGTLVVAMFRNPFEWIEAMRARPHHASEHIKLNWREFVTKPWIMDRVGFDLNMTPEEQKKPFACQENFMYRDIVTCHTRPYPEGHFAKTYMSNHQPFYEMKNDGSGQPYDNILEMRAAKNRNFLSVKDYKAVKELWVVQYEALLEGGTHELIHDIEQMTGVKAKCEAYPRQIRRQRKMSGDEIQYLKEHVVWDAEEFIGYRRSGIRRHPTNSTIIGKFPLCEFMRMRLE